MPSSIRKKWLILIFVLLMVILSSVATIRIADYHPFAPSPNPHPVSENATPEGVFAQARLHLEHSTVTVRVHTNVREETPTDSPVHIVYKSNSERNRLYTFMYQYDGNETWTTTCTYITDGSSIAKIGTVHSTEPPEFCETGNSTDWFSFDRKESGEPATFGLNEWEGKQELSQLWDITSRNESAVILRTTDFDAFVAIEGGTVDEDITNGSMTFFVNSDTGRITRVERVIEVKEDDGGTRRKQTTYQFYKYRKTNVSPPESIDFPTLNELIIDTIVY